jgi:hypothetical protein
MRSGFFVVPLVGLLLCAPAFAQPTPKGNTNAAIKYWQAFGLMPTLTKDQEKILHEWEKAPLDAAALKLIDQSKNSLDYLHRAARLDKCDWSLDYDDGIRMLMPHVGKARTLAQLAALRARSEFEKGDAKAGVADVVAILNLARHVEIDPMPIGQLVGYAIEAMAYQSAAPYLPAAKDALGELATAVNRPPAGATFAQMLGIEKRTAGEWLGRELRAADKRKPGSWRNVWAELFAPNEGWPGLKVPETSSVDEALKPLEGLPALYDQLARLSELPPKEFDAKYPEWLAKATADSPTAAAILPALDKIMAAHRRAAVRLALFRTAVAVVQGGPDKVKESKDPSGDGPFEYKATDGGFELKSKLTIKDQPVTLVVGKK